MEPSGATRRARELRRASTDAERKLWSRLRARALDGAKFRRQHPVGGYILDFACAEAALAVELDGGQHATPDKAAQDAARTAFLEKEGWTVLRFWNHEVLANTDGVLQTIRTALRAGSMR